MRSPFTQRGLTVARRLAGLSDLCTVNVELGELRAVARGAVRRPREADVSRLHGSFERDGNVYSLLNVFPGTGRKHQIRIHLSWMGCPIVGDKLYGESPEYYLAFVENRLSEEQRQKLILPYHALHAKSLSFTTFSGKEYYFECPPEKWFREFAMF